MAEDPSADDVLKSLRSNIKSDYLRVATNRVLISFLDKNNKTNRDLEVVEFSDSVLKINKRGKEQERDLIITNMAVYNFVPGKYKTAQRAIPIRQLQGLILSRNNDELLFQVKGEYDYRFRIVRRAEVVEIVSRFFEKLCGTKILAQFTDDVSSVQITKDDIKKRGSKIDRDAVAVAGGATISAAAVIESASHAAQLKESESNASYRRNSNSETDWNGQESWLTKKGNTNALFRRRYFRLGDSNLLYYEARTKGCIPIEQGSCLGWMNNRYNVVVREAQEPSTPNHLQDIMRDPERRDAFMAFCQSMMCTEGAKFYVAVERFHSIEQDTLEQQNEAKKIYDTFLKNGAELEIPAPPQPRLDCKERLEKKMIAFDMFDDLQQMSLALMRVALLPQYLQYASKQLAEEGYQIKKELDETDKKVEQCTLCTAKFTFTRRRNFCQYCNKVYCNSCLTKQSALPEPFEKGQFRVCDICHGLLNPTPHTRFAFTYASAQRTKPLNLAAENQGEMLKWIQVLRNNLSVSKIRSSVQQKSGGQSEIVHLTYNASHKARGAPSSGNGAAVIDDTRLEGWLWKEDPTTKTWRRRYFVLSDCRLWYYEMGLKGTIPLTQGFSLHSTVEKPTLTKEDATFGGFSSQSCFKYRFNINTNQRVYQVAADTPEDLAKWIDSLQSAISSDLPAQVTEEKTPEEYAVYSEAFKEEAPEGSVTFVFTDVQSSTKLWEAVPDGMNAGLEEHDALLRRLLKRFRGYEVKTEGDAFMVTFFSPIDAILWCIYVQRELLKIEWESDLLKHPSAAIEYAKNGDDKTNPVFKGIRIRMGIHTGTPNCRRNPVTGRMDYFGPVVNRSARVSDSAHGGQIICTEEVHAALMEALSAKSFAEEVVIDELGEFPYKGIATLVKIYQISPKDLIGRNPFPPLRMSKDEAPAPNENGETAPEETEAA